MVPIEPGPIGELAIPVKKGEVARTALVTEPKTQANVTTVATITMTPGRWLPKPMASAIPATTSALVLIRQL